MKLTFIIEKSAKYAYFFFLTKWHIMIGNTLFIKILTRNIEDHNTSVLLKKGTAFYFTYEYDIYV